MIIATILFSCLLIVFYVYAGYPLIMAVWASFCRRRRKAGREAVAHEKSKCSVVIAVYNDAQLLARKLRLLLDSDGGWIDEILIGSDGSRDDIESIIAALDDERIKLFAFRDRRGKTAVLNEIVPKCRNELVVLMDARQLVKKGSIPALLVRFDDPRVGVVSGELIFRNEEWIEQNSGSGGPGSMVAEGMGAYWNYEKWIRKNEAVASSVPGATGACYAIRKSIFTRIPVDTVLDDVAYPMQAVVQGYRCVFEENAVVYDVPSNHSRQESIRKRRTLAGNVQLIRFFPEWLLPGCNPIAFQFISHKVLRLFVPFLMLFSVLLALLGAIFASDPRFFAFFAGISLFFYIFAGCCIVGAIYERRGVKSRFFALFWMFFVLNRITFLGVIDGILGRYKVAWEKAYGEV